MTTPLVSIITVTFNAEKFIERTLLSIASQTYENIESIIIDGLSKDNTIELINKYRIQNSKLISEKDQGLYDAMNKGIELSNGEYIIFMNAGDVFYSSDTIQKVFENKKTEDFIYGDTKIIDSHGNLKSYHKSKPSQLDISYNSFINGMVVCHQSMFIKKSCVEQFDFSRFKLACDIDWTIKSLKNCTSFRDTGLIISKFLEGGVSQNNRFKAVKERFWICVKHFGWKETIFTNIKLLLKFILI